jgi:hypothetical protein
MRKNLIVPFGLMLQEFAPMVLVVHDPVIEGATKSTPPDGQFRDIWPPAILLLTTNVAGATICWRLPVLPKWLP